MKPWVGSALPLSGSRGLSAQGSTASYVRRGTNERAHKKGSKAQLLFGSCDLLTFSHAVNTPHALSVSDAVRWGGGVQSPFREMAGQRPSVRGSFPQTAPSLSGGCGPVTVEAPGHSLIFPTQGFTFPDTQALRGGDHLSPP